MQRARRSRKLLPSSDHPKTEHSSHAFARVTVTPAATRKFGSNCFVRFSPIVLKKSVGAVALIFSAPWKRFQKKDAGGLMGERQRDVRRSK